MTKEINNRDLSAAELAKVSGGEGIRIPTIPGHCPGYDPENDSPCNSSMRGKCAECRDCPRRYA